MVSRAEDDWSPPADLWPEDGEDIEIALTLQQALSTSGWTFPAPRPQPNR